MGIAVCSSRAHRRPARIFALEAVAATIAKVLLLVFLVLFVVSLIAGGPGRRVV
jgi:hypothetical protein